MTTASAVEKKDDGAGQAAREGAQAGVGTASPQSTGGDALGLGYDRTAATSDAPVVWTVSITRRALAVTMMARTLPVV